MSTLAEAAQTIREKEMGWRSLASYEAEEDAWWSDELFVERHVNAEAPKLAKRLVENDVFICRVYEEYGNEFTAAIKKAVVEGDYIACGHALKQLCEKAAEERAADIMEQDARHFLRCYAGAREWTEDTEPVPNEADDVNLEAYL